MDSVPPPQGERVTQAIRAVLATRRRLSPLAHEFGLMIVSGQLKQGDALSEKIFGTGRGISRTSFREAMKVLEGKGLVVSRQNTGTQVAPRSNWHLLDPELLSWRIASGSIGSFVSDFFEFRRTVEPSAAEMAAQHPGHAAIAEARAAFEQMRQLEPIDPFGERYVEADMRFHQSLFAASENEFLVAIGHILEVPMMLSFTLTSSLHVGPANRLALHEAVLIQVERGNPLRARAAMLALLSDVSRDVDSVTRGEGIAGPPES